MTLAADDANSLPTDDAPVPPTDAAPPQNAPAGASADAPVDPPADEPADPPSDDPPPPDTDDDHDDQPGSRAQKRIRETLAERNAAMEYAEYWRNKALELARQDGKPPTAQPAAEKPAPKLDDFDSTEKWAEAYAAWNDERIEKRIAEATTKTLTKRDQEAQRATAAQQWGERLAKFAAQKPDAQAVIANPALPITEAMSEVITASEFGPEIAYHLGTNPSEAARIARLSPTQQAAALGRLEAKLANDTPPPKPPARRPTSKAPEPPSPIDGAGTPSVDLESCSLNEFLERRLGRKKRA